MSQFLKGFDDKYKTARADAKAGPETDRIYEEISDGRYQAVITGMGWRDYQNRNPEKWSGMGPIIRLRIMAAGDGKETRFVGWREDVTYFIISRNPERGMLEPELNGKKLDFFVRQMARLGVDTPATISDLAAWGEDQASSSPVGKPVLITIKTTSSDNRTYRNVYFDGIPPESTRSSRQYELELYEGDPPRWNKSGPHSLVPARPVSIDEQPSSSVQLEDIPF